MADLSEEEAGIIYDAMQADPSISVEAAIDAYLEFRDGSSSAGPIEPTTDAAAGGGFSFAPAGTPESSLSSRIDEPDAQPAGPSPAPLQASSLAPTVRRDQALGESESLVKQASEAVVGFPSAIGRLASGAASAVEQTGRGLISGAAGLAGAVAGKMAEVGPSTLEPLYPGASQLSEKQQRFIEAGRATRADVARRAPSEAVEQAGLGLDPRIGGRIRRAYQPLAEHVPAMEGDLVGQAARIGGAARKLGESVVGADLDRSSEAGGGIKLGEQGKPRGLETVLPAAQGLLGETMAPIMAPFSVGFQLPVEAVAQSLRDAGYQPEPRGVEDAVRAVANMAELVGSLPMVSRALSAVPGKLARPMSAAFAADLATSTGEQVQQASEQEQKVSFEQMSDAATTAAFALMSAIHASRPRGLETPPPTKNETDFLLDKILEAPEFQKMPDGTVRRVEVLVNEAMEKAVTKEAEPAAPSVPVVEPTAPSQPPTPAIAADSSQPTIQPMPRLQVGPPQVSQGTRVTAPEARPETRADISQPFAFQSPQAEAKAPIRRDAPPSPPPETRPEAPPPVAREVAKPPAVELAKPSEPEARPARLVELLDRAASGDASVADAIRQHPRFTQKAEKKQVAVAEFRKVGGVAQRKAIKTALLREDPKLGRERLDLLADAASAAFQGFVEESPFVLRIPEGLEFNPELRRLTPALKAGLEIKDRTQAPTEVKLSEVGRFAAKKEAIERVDEAVGVREETGRAAARVKTLVDELNAGLEPGARDVRLAELQSEVRRFEDLIVKAEEGKKSEEKQATRAKKAAEKREDLPALFKNVREVVGDGLSESDISLAEKTLGAVLKRAAAAGRGDDVASLRKFASEHGLELPDVPMPKDYVASVDREIARAKKEPPKIKGSVSNVGEKGPSVSFSSRNTPAIVRRVVDPEVGYKAAVAETNRPAKPPVEGAKAKRPKLVRVQKVAVPVTDRQAPTDVRLYRVKPKAGAEASGDRYGATKEHLARFRKSGDLGDLVLIPEGFDRADLRLYETFFAPRKEDMTFQNDQGMVRIVGPVAEGKMASRLWAGSMYERFTQILDSGPKAAHDEVRNFRITFDARKRSGENPSESELSKPARDMLRQINEEVERPAARMLGVAEDKIENHLAQIYLNREIDFLRDSAGGSQFEKERKNHFDSVEDAEAAGLLMDQRVAEYIYLQAVGDAHFVKPRLPDAAVWIAMAPSGSRELYRNMLTDIIHGLSIKARDAASRFPLTSEGLNAYTAVVYAVQLGALPAALVKRAGFGLGAQVAASVGNMAAPVINASQMALANAFVGPRAVARGVSLMAKLGPEKFFRLAKRMGFTGSDFGDEMALLIRDMRPPKSAVADTSKLTQWFYDKLSSAASGARGLASDSMMAFLGVEQIMRGVVGVGSFADALDAVALTKADPYRLSVRLGMSKYAQGEVPWILEPLKTGNHEAFARRLAQSNVDSTLFAYAPENHSGIIRAIRDAAGPALGQSVSQFLTFSMQMSFTYLRKMAGLKTRSRALDTLLKDKTSQFVDAQGKGFETQANEILSALQEKRGFSRPMALFTFITTIGAYHQALRQTGVNIGSSLALDPDDVIPGGSPAAQALNGFWQFTGALASDRKSSKQASAVFKATMRGLARSLSPRNSPRILNLLIDYTHAEPEEKHTIIRKFNRLDQREKDLFYEVFGVQNVQDIVHQMDAFPVRDRKHNILFYQALPQVLAEAIGFTSERRAAAVSANAWLDETMRLIREDGAISRGEMDGLEKAIHDFKTRYKGIRDTGSKMLRSVVP